VYYKTLQGTTDFELQLTHFSFNVSRICPCMTFAWIDFPEKFELLKVKEKRFTCKHIIQRLLLKSALLLLWKYLWENAELERRLWIRTCRLAKEKFAFTGHNSQTSFSKNIRSSSNRDLRRRTMVNT
jgi:hypothetical protein